MRKRVAGLTSVSLRMTWAEVEDTAASCCDPYDSLSRSFAFVEISALGEGGGAVPLDAPLMLSA